MFGAGVGANDEAGFNLSVSTGRVGMRIGPVGAIGASAGVAAVGEEATAVGGVSTTGAFKRAVGAGIAVDTGSGGANSAGSPQANASASATGAR